MASDREELTRRSWAMGELLHQSQRKCPECGVWLTPICGGTDYTCANARCGASWQAARRAFKTSLLGAACRQVFGHG